MTDNLPDVRRTADVATTSPTNPDSWIPVVENYAALAQRIAGTDFVPKGLRGKPEAVAAALLYGREVGLPPMTALTMTHVVEGKPAIEAEGMRALVLAQGHELEFLEKTGAVCRMRARRRGSETWTELSWTLDMARAAGLLGKDNWKSYPRAMLTARCTAELCRDVFPDVIHGFQALEEAHDVDATPRPTEGPVETSKVSRRTRTPRKALEAPTADPPPRTAPSRTRPPLPGELASAPAAEEAPIPREEASGAVDSPGDSSLPGEATEPPAGADASPTEPAPAALEEPDEVHEAELVDEEPATVDEGPKLPPVDATRAQIRMLHASLNALGYEEREDKLRIVGRLAHRELESTNELTKDEASTVIDALARVKSRDELEGILDATQDLP